MVKRDDDDDVIQKVESVPPPDGDEAYAAPTKVGEAAYRMLAEGMAMFEAPPSSTPSSKQPSSKRPVQVDKPGFDEASDTAPLPKINASDEPEQATTVMPQLVATPPPVEPQPVAAPVVSSTVTVPPTKAAVEPRRRFRMEVVVGVVSFVVVFAAAATYLWLR